MAKKAKEWRVYKPKKTNDGAASKLELSIKGKDIVGKDNKPLTIRVVNVFWVSAKQTGTDANDNASFGWSDEDKNVTLKLGEVDLGEILAVLNNEKVITGATEGNYKGIFHKNDKGSASFSIEKHAKGYNVRASKKIGAAAPVQITHQLTFGEAQILKQVVEAAVKQIYAW